MRYDMTLASVPPQYVLGSRHIGLKAAVDGCLFTHRRAICDHTMSAMVTMADDISASPRLAFMSLRADQGGTLAAL